VALAIALGSVAQSACSIIPSSRLDECRRLSQTLQAENSRLKDTAVSLRSQNQDLNQRAVEDARRLRVQEDEIQRLVQSVSAYQQDREQLAAAFERLKRQIQTGSGPLSSGLLDRLQDLARTHSGWAFDPERSVLTIPAVQLFEAGSDRLRTEAETWLQETAALWNAPEARDFDMLIIGRNQTSPVRPAGLAPEEAQSRPLGLARAARVRSRLTAQGGIDPARIEVAGFELPADGADGGDPSAIGNRRIEIHLRPRPTAVAPPVPPGSSAPPPQAPGAK
jgi:chemotaxis protein MotB